MRRTITVVLGLSLLIAAVVEPPTSAQSPQPVRNDVVLPDAHSFLLPGKDAADPYRIFVALPSSYQDSTERYPVLYTLDANASFALVTQTYRILRVDPATPDLIIVGVGYDGQPGERRARRARDLTPTRRRSDSNTGGSRAFLTFVADGLVPFIDSNYRTVPSDRTLHGHSLGGLFVLYSLFEQPDLFRRYIASSPSLWWDEAAILRSAVEFGKRQPSHARSLFLSVGSEEAEDMRLHFQPLVDSLRSASDSGLRLDAVVVPAEDHLSIIGPAFTRGLRSVFRAEPSGRPRNDHIR